MRYVLLGVCMMAMGAGCGGTGPVARVNFEGLPTGAVSDEAIKSLWDDAVWASTHGRASIVDDADPARGTVLRVRYPAGTIGPPDNGIQFLVNLPPAEEYWLSYWLKFEDGFDFRRGGKLPGLTSGGGKFTGGHHPTEGEGWSARYMWTRDGGAIVYLYSVDMPGHWGEGLRLEDVRFVPGTWHRLTQHIRLNTADNADGVLEVWFDGTKVYADGTERFRLGGRGAIDSFYFSTFHGGNTTDWAPNVDSAARYDDIVITSEPPASP